MKIRVIFLEEDANYIERIVSVFNSKYSDKLQVFSFTNKAKALEAAKAHKVNVFVAGDEFEIEESDLPNRCTLAYLVDGMVSVNNDEHPTINKYQKVEMIYKQILSIYSEAAGNIGSMSESKEGTNVIWFTSFSGGCGNSTLAAAYSIYLSSQGKKTMYLNLEKNGDPEVFFTGDGQYSMSDIIYTLKSGKGNLAMKIESSVRISEEGVYYIAAPNVALDFLELNTEEVVRLVNTIIRENGYDFVILDAPFDYGKLSEKLWEESDRVAIVLDGNENSISKFEKSYHVVNILGQQRDVYNPIKAKMIYNKFSNKTGRMLTDLDIETVGGIPKLENANNQQIVHHVVGVDVWNKLY